MARLSTFCAALAFTTVGAFAAPCDHVEGSGSVVRKALSVQAFHGIAVEGSIDVVLSPAGSQKVEVEAQENLVGLVTTDVRNGVWTISTSKGFSTSKPFVVHVSVPVIDMVRIDGSGDVKGTGAFTAGRVDLAIQGSGDIDLAFNASSVEASVHGSGDIKLNGRCTDLKADVQGSGDINAKELRVESAFASTAGSGNITVYTSGRLTAVITGSGDVVYSGDPANVTTSVVGSGEVSASRTSGRL